MLVWQVRHVFPLCFLGPQENGPELQHACKHGILQYVVVRPASTLVAFCCQQAGVYGEGEFSPSVAFPYLFLVNNASQFAAMYCLVLFYRANRVRLRPMRPLPKFLCIKAVVFFSFFQQVIVALLVRLGALDAILPPEDKQVRYPLSFTPTPRKKSTLKCSCAQTKFQRKRSKCPHLISPQLATPLF